MNKKNQCPTCQGLKDTRAKQCNDCRKSKELDDRKGKSRSPSFFNQCVCGSLKDKRARQCNDCRIKTNNKNRKPTITPTKKCRCGKEMSWKSKECLECYVESVRPDLEEPRTCSNCQQTKTADCYYKWVRAKPQKRVTCIECCRIQGRIRNKRSKCIKYGLSEGKADQISQLNEAKCEICGDITIDFHIDHCHSTNQFRGILCRKCNPGLGCFNDDIRLLKKAIKYLSCFRNV